MRTIRAIALVAVLGLLLGQSPRPLEGQQQLLGAINVEIVKYSKLCDLVEKNKGKVILLDFWATNCPPCKASFFHTVEMYNKYRDKGLVVVSVSTDEPKDNKPALVQKFLESKKATFTNLILDESEKLLDQKLHITSIPCLYVFNRDGKWTQFIGNNLEPDNDHRHMNVENYIKYLLDQPARNN